MKNKMDALDRVLKKEALTQQYLTRVKELKMERSTLNSNIQRLEKALDQLIYSDHDQLELFDNIELFDGSRSEEESNKNT